MFEHYIKLTQTYRIKFTTALQHFTNLRTKETLPTSIKRKDKENIIIRAEKIRNKTTYKKRKAEGLDQINNKMLKYG